MRSRQLNHSVYQGQYHLVWGTKYRRKILKHYVRKELIKSFYKTQKSYPDWYFIKINTDNDHVHFLVQSVPMYSPKKIVQVIKSITAREMFERMPEIKKELGDVYIVF